MASIGGVSSSNMTSSLYNSANTISGLASGLDTEGMIESLVQSYQTKINQLNQKVTKIEWKQDAYRSIIQKMYGFSQKYTSYSSGTNLMSPSFFNNAVKVATLGKFADKVTATGKSSSDIALNAVNQLATAAQFRTAGSLISGDGKSIQASGSMDLNGETLLSTLDGSLTLTYGSKNVTVKFDQVADVKAMDEIRARKEAAGQSATDADVLAELINQKLDGQKITLTGGTSADATDRIKVSVKDGVISFSDKSSAGNSVFISKTSGNVGSVLGVEDALDKAEEDKDKPTQFKVGDLTKKVDNASYLSGQTMSLSLDGISKTITMPVIGKDSDGNMKIKDADGNLLDYTAENYTKVLSDAVQSAFKGKVKVQNLKASNPPSDSDKLQLRFDVQEGSNLVINTDVGETLGIGRTATSYLNTSKTLEDLLGMDKLDGLTAAKDKDGNDLLDSKGNKLYTFEINGVKVGNYSKDSKLSDIMADINASDAGVKVSYSQTTKNFLFTAKETGAESEINISGGLAEAMFGTTEFPEQSSGGGSFTERYGMIWVGPGDTERVTFSFSKINLSLDVSGSDTVEDVADKLNETIYNFGWTAGYNKYTGELEITDKSGKAVNFAIKDSWGDEATFDKDYAPSIDYTPGQDAKFTVTVNGEQINMTRSSNTVNIDGLNITMKETFDATVDENGNKLSDAKIAENSVTFKTSVDSDKIVDAIKTMIEDYNDMMKEIKSAYSTMPYQSSSGAFANYEPLTDDDKDGMSESAIERYEEKAKQGILFGDRNLSRLYEKMRDVFSGENGYYLRAMGITTSFSTSDGLQTVSLDEDKLRAMLDSEPDKVTEVFTNAETGVMAKMKTQLDTYAKTTGEPKGILIQQAGSPLSSLSLMSNTWQKEIDNINTQIEKWQDKLADQVDRYTQQFSRLEVLIQQMNSQSSTLAGLMGGY